MIQFIIFIIHALQPLFIECSYPKVRGPVQVATSFTTFSLKLELIIKDFWNFKLYGVFKEFIICSTLGVLLDHPGSRLFVFPAVCQLLHQVLSRLRLRHGVKVRVSEKQTGVMSEN